METSLSSQDNSLVLRIPHEAQQKLGLNEGDKMTISFEGSSLLLTPVKKLPATFEELWGNHPPVYIEKEIKGVVGDEW